MPAANEDGQDHICPGCNCLSPQEADFETTPSTNSKLRGSQGIFRKAVSFIKFKIQIFFTEHILVVIVWCISMVVYGYSFIVGLTKRILDNDKDFV